MDSSKGLNIKLVSKKEFYIGAVFFVLLLIGFYGLTSVNFMGGTVKFNMSGVMGYVNSGTPNGGSGLYGLLLIIALFSPLAPAFINDRRSFLAGFLPVIITLIVMWCIHHQIATMKEQAQNAFSALSGRSNQSNPFADSFNDMITYGFGIYFNLIISILLAIRSYFKYKK